MATQYLCKACRGVLNVKTSIILAALKNNSSKKGLFLLKMEEGEEYLIKCPICHAHLNSLKYDHLVRIIMVDDNGKEFDIYFSDIVGEKCTYKLSGSSVEKIGPDAVKYDKYFDVPEEDRKYL
jgi:hypothetical protein